jgi:hypothetical protein
MSGARFHEVHLAGLYVDLFISDAQAQMAADYQ